MARSRLLLLLALLPGLLLSSGASVRVCLHGLLGARAECGPCQADAPACCGGQERAPAPSLAAGDDCADCCLDLEAAAQLLGSGERLAEQVSLPPPAPIAAAALRQHGDDARRAPPLAARSPRGSPNAPGVLPLRI